MQWRTRHALNCLLGATLLVSLWQLLLNGLTTAAPAPAVPRSVAEITITDQHGKPTSILTKSRRSLFLVIAPTCPAAWEVAPEWRLALEHHVDSTLHIAVLTFPLANDHGIGAHPF